MPKIKYSISGAFLSQSPSSLFYYSPGYLSTKESGSRCLLFQTAAGERPADSWIEHLPKHKKIGVVHRTFTARDNGFHFGENVFMQINTLGVTQALNISTEATLIPI